MADIIEITPPFSGDGSCIIHITEVGDRFVFDLNTDLDDDELYYLLIGAARSIFDGPLN